VRKGAHIISKMATLHLGTKRAAWRTPQGLGIGKARKSEREGAGVLSYVEDITHQRYTRYSVAWTDFLI
jgi:hypothetical protein